MFSLLRNRFGIPGLISVVALVFAMFGGAYAATNGNPLASASKKQRNFKKKQQGLNGKQKSEVKNIAKQFPGPAGPQGPAGAKGNDGGKGSDGATGPTGVAGQGVGIGATGPSECSGRGGVKVTAGATSQAACNGAQGTQGIQGNPGTAGSPWVVGKAPKGVLLKGTWTLPQPYTAAAAGEEISVAVSTGVPVGQIFAVPAGPEPFSGCTGTVENPESEIEGFLCVYREGDTNLEESLFSSKFLTSGGGALLRFKSIAAGPVTGYGTWALRTAE
jgi:hypothetical protein